jgi:hypothetical protein
MRRHGLVIRSCFAVIAVLGIVSSTSALAEAHHGSNGRYDRSKPLYIEGRVTTATYNQPHALINIEPAQPKMPPADLFSLDSTSYARLGGRDVVERTRPIEATGEGLLTLLLPPPMTADAAGLPRPPARGDVVGAIIFRECSTGELRVQLLRLSATERLVRNGVIQREVDGCDLPTPSLAPTASPAAAVASPIPTSPVEVATKPRSDDASLALLLGAAALAAVVGLGLGLALARRGMS